MLSSRWLHLAPKHFLSSWSGILHLVKIFSQFSLVLSLGTHQYVSMDILSLDRYNIIEIICSSVILCFHWTLFLRFLSFLFVTEECLTLYLFIHSLLMSVLVDISSNSCDLCYDEHSFSGIGLQMFLIPFGYLPKSRLSEAPGNLIFNCIEELKDCQTEHLPCIQLTRFVPSLALHFVTHTWPWVISWVQSQSKPWALMGVTQI